MSIPTWWEALTLFCVIGVVLLAILLAAAYRQLGNILLAMPRPRMGDVGEGPEMGSDLTDLGIAIVMPTLIIFLSRTCSVCPPIAAAVPVLRRAYPEIQVMPAIIGESGKAKDQYSQKLSPARVDLDWLYESWAIPGTPFVVGVDRNGVVRARGVANTLPQLEEMAEALGHQDRHPASSSAHLPIVPATPASAIHPHPSHEEVNAP